MSEDQRVVYGYRCIWWDGIEKVALTPSTPSGISVPCCPFCGGMLFEMDSPKEWWDQVETYQAEGHPGYRAFQEWLKGKHFYTIAEAKAAYEARPGRTVTL